MNRLILTAEQQSIQQPDKRHIAVVLASLFKAQHEFIKADNFDRIGALLKLLCIVLNRLLHSLQTLAENEREHDGNLPFIKGEMSMTGIVAEEESPHVRESTKVLDSGSQPLEPIFWIPDSIPKRRIPDSKTIVDSGFQSLDSGFQQQKFAGFRIPDSLTWGEKRNASIERQCLIQTASHTWHSWTVPFS